MVRPTLDELREQLGGIKKSQRPIRRMQGKHGMPAHGVTCGECAFLKTQNYGTRSFFKCALYSMSKSEASDFRKSWPGCGAFKEK